MSNDENFYQYHNADDKKIRVFIVVFIIGYLLGEEVAHNLLGGRDPSLVNGLGSTALPYSVFWRALQSRYLETVAGRIYAEILLTRLKPTASGQ